MKGTSATSKKAPEPEVLQLAVELFDHARHGRSAELEQYVDAGIPVSLRDHSGNSLLMLAAYYGQVDTVRALAALGADIDKANDQGQTPLAGAVFKRHLEVVDALVELGADPFDGTPSAFNTAVAFGLNDLAERFTRS